MEFATRTDVIFCIMENSTIPFEAGPMQFQTSLRTLPALRRLLARNFNFRRPLTRCGTTIVRYLGTTVEESIGPKTPPAKLGPTPKLQQHIERMNTWPRAQRQLMINMLDGVLGHACR